VSARFAAAALTSALVVGGVLLGVGVVELWLRHDDRRPPYRPASLEINGASYQFHEEPHRLDSLEDAVVFVGDSFTEGRNCSTDATYPARFGILARRAGGPGAVNLGRSGQGPFDYLALVAELVEADRAPRAVVVTLFVNDTGATCSLCVFFDEIASSGDFDPAEMARLEALCEACSRNPAHQKPGLLLGLHLRLHDASNVYKVLRKAAFALGASLGLNISQMGSHTAHWADPLSLEFRLVTLALRLTALELESAGTPGVAVLYPEVVQVATDNPKVEIYSRAAASLSQTSGMPVLSGYPAFLEADEPRPSWTHSLVDSHPSCEAHALFAQWVFEEYAGRFPLP
jgi:hypothetical protein